MISTTFNLDLATAYRETQEERATALRTGITAFAIVIEIDGNCVELVTQCDTQGRIDWRDLLGINLVQDIDADWAMAWINADGSISHAGPNLGYVKIAQNNLRQYRFSDTELRLTVENSDAHTSPFTFLGEGDEGSICEDADVMPEERLGALNLYGLDLTTGEWGVAWQPVSLPDATEDCPDPEPVFHSVIAAVGTDILAAYLAFRDLAACN